MNGLDERFNPCIDINVMMLVLYIIVSIYGLGVKVEVLSDNQDFIKCF